jgi:hypothetical protein
LFVPPKLIPGNLKPWWSPDSLIGSQLASEKAPTLAQKAEVP